MAKTRDPKMRKNFLRQGDAQLTPEPGKTKVKIKVTLPKASDPAASGSPAAKPASPTAGKATHSVLPSKAAQSPGPAAGNLTKPSPTAAPIKAAPPSHRKGTGGKLSAILAAGGNYIRDAWDTTTAAGDYGPLPGGPYVARIESGKLDKSPLKGTPEYQLEFIVVEGEFANRRFWHHMWLTPAALPQTKRDLGKLGITRLEQLEQPLTEGIICRVQLALRRDDDGNANNRVVTLEVIAIEPPEADPFAPKDEEESDD